MTRREMLGRSALLAGAVVGISSKSRAADRESSNIVRFTMDLRCGSIGVNADQRTAIELADAHGFESVTPDPAFLSKISDSERDALRDDMQAKRLLWGAAGLPVEFRKDEDTFQAGLRKLPRLALGMQRAGVRRVGTWIRPYHDELTYVRNFRQHAKRLRSCARILSDHGQRFGLEYVGPKTLWASKRHSFVHSMAGMKDLIAEINVGNMGFVLDSWHWYTAHETADDLRTLTNRDIVACDLNDAPAGIEIDRQIDNQRELPAATGVIDLKTFLGMLVELEYDGPIRAEPFNRALNELDNQPAVAATAAAMRKAFDLVLRKPA